MGHLLADARLAVRKLVQNPGFSVVAILTLALGLGVNTAIFTVTNAVLRQKLPVAHADDLYRVGLDNDCCVNGGLQNNYSLVSTRLFEHLREASAASFVSLTGFQANNTHTGVRRTGADVTESLRAAYVSGEYFETLGVSPALGRLLTPDDDRPGAPGVFVVSHRTWTQRMSADPTAIGAAFLVGGHPMTLVGVTAPSFFGEAVRPEPPGVWLPLGQEAAVRGASSLVDRTGSNWLYVLGRLAPGVTPEQASSVMTSALRQFLVEQGLASSDDPETLARQQIHLRAAPGGVDILRDTYAQPLKALFAMSLAVLLIAASNLANLMLARADRGQAAIRVSLGASSGRLVSQALTEGLMLALVGGVAGLFVAVLATRAIIALAFPVDAFLPLDVSPSLTVLLFSLALTLLTGALFSCAPALAMSRTDPADTLRGVGRGGSRRSFVPRRALVIAQVALSTVLLTGAGLLAESLRRLEQQPLGFDPSNRIAVMINPPSYAGEPERLAAAYDRMVRGIEQIPGVRRTSYAMYGPMEGNNWSGTVSMTGRPTNPETPDNASWNKVGPNYFATVGTPVLRGRAFDDRDTPTGARVAVVNETFARRFFENTDPIGQHVGLGGPERANDYEIVGVVADVKYFDARQPARPMVFFPLMQRVDYGDNAGAASVQTRSLLARALIIETAGQVANLESAVRSALAAADPDLTLVRMSTMEQQVSGNFRTNRLLASLTSAYGLLALALATLGVYGVTAYGVTQRRREIGIRMALGASAGRVTKDILTGAVGQTALGLALGIPAALAAVTIVASFLYQVEARDPRVIGSTAAVLLVSAAAAGFAPARRASRISPTEALRSE